MRLQAVVVCVLAIFAAACQTAAPASAPPTLAALQGDYFRLESAALGRPMHIYVSLPENYARETRTYPTVYITDGDSLFPLLAPTHLFLTYDEPTPPAILVGIAYGTFGEGNMRHVDFRWPSPEAPDRGAAAYQRFLADEVIPEIERRFRSDPQRRVLVGQSRGGGFVLYSALTAPDLFWGRIASNPAMRPLDAFQGDAAPATRRDLGLFVASGERDHEDLRREVQAWTQTWSARAERPWDFNAVSLENGTHAATIGEVYRQGLIWLFRNEAGTAD